MADARGNVTNAIMAGGPMTRGGPQTISPYGSGFTSFAPPRPVAAPQAGGFAPPPGATGAALFAPPPPPMLGGAGGGGIAPPPPPGGGGGLFAAPPAAGAPMPSNVVPHTPRPFTSMFSPGALANPGGNAMRGRGY